MVREKYRQQLVGLQEATVAMGADAAQRLERAIGLLRSPGAEDARAFVDEDEAIDHQYLDIERRCLDLFALQQPVAGDLRLIAASFKISTDIERVADLALNLAQYAQDLHANLQFLPEPDGLFSLGRQALHMLQRAVHAYATRDEDAALHVIHADEQADQLFWDLTHTLVSTLMNTCRARADLPEDTASGIVGLLLALRDLERAADHAVNIAARTIYMCTGQSSFV